MTITGFLNIPGIEGAATYQSHEDEIDVYSVAWQIGDPEDGADSGARRRRAVQWTTFDFGKWYDKSSPAITSAVSTGKTFDEIVFVAAGTAGGGQSMDYLKITMPNATIASYRLDTGDGQLREIVSVRCEKLTIDYTETDANGTQLGHLVEQISAG